MDDIGIFDTFFKFESHILSYKLIQDLKALFYKQSWILVTDIFVLH